MQAQCSGLGLALAEDVEVADPWAVSSLALSQRGLYYLCFWSPQLLPFGFYGRPVSLMLPGFGGLRVVSLP